MNLYSNYTKFNIADDREYKIKKALKEVENGVLWAIAG